MIYFSNLIIPLTFIVIITYGFIKKVSLFEEFLEGAKEGVDIVFKIVPTIMALMIAIYVFRNSGALDILVGFFAPITNLTDFPKDLLPLSIIKMVSSSAGNALLLDIFKNFGTDSFLGRVASTIMGSTETIFYTMSLYFMSVSIKNSRYTLTVAILTNVVGIIASYFSVKFILM